MTKKNILQKVALNITNKGLGNAYRNIVKSVKGQTGYAKYKTMADKTMKLRRIGSELGRRGNNEGSLVANKLSNTLFIPSARGNPTANFGPTGLKIMNGKI